MSVTFTGKVGDRVEVTSNCHYYRPIPQGSSGTVVAISSIHHRTENGGGVDVTLELDDAWPEPLIGWSGHPESPTRVTIRSTMLTVAPRCPLTFQRFNPIDTQAQRCGKTEGHDGSCESNAATAWASRD